MERIEGPDRRTLSRSLRGILGSLGLGLALGLASGLPSRAAEAVQGTTNSEPSLSTIREFLAGARVAGESNRVRLRGVVTASLVGNSYFIQEDEAGVYVFHRPATPFKVGDWVEVIGQPSLGGISPTLQHCTARTLGVREPPVPYAVTYDDLLRGRHDMRLVRVRGLLSAERPRGGQTWVFTSGDPTNAFLASLETVVDFGALARIEPGSLLDLTGVCSTRTVPGKRPGYFIIQLRSATDVTVVKGPSWWTRERALWVLGIALAALGLALLWGWMLRREVRRRMVDLRSQLERETQLEQRYRQLIEAEPECVKVVAADGALLDMNPAGLAMLEAGSLAEAQSRPLIKYIRPEHQNAFIGLHQSVLAGKGGTLEFEIDGLKGTRRWLETHAVPLPGANGDPPALLSVTRDITERKASEEQLRRSAAQLSAAQRIASIGSWEMELTDTAHLDRNRLMWSDEVFCIFGYAPGSVEVTNETFFRSVHPEDRERVQQSVAEALEQRRPYRLEHRIIRPDGSERVVREYSETSVDPATGRLLRMLGVVQDITEQKAAEVGRQRALDTLQIFIDSVPGYVSFIDANQRYQLVNPSYEGWFGRDRHSIVGLRLDELHPPDIYAEMRPMVERALAGEPVRYERSLPDAAGRCHWFDVRYIPRRAENGAVSGFFALVFEITSQKEAEAALHESRGQLEQKVSARTAELDRLYRQMALLAELELSVTQPSELQVTLERAVNKVGEVLGTDGGASVSLWDSAKDALAPSASSGPGLAVDLAARGPGQAGRWILEHCQPHIVSDLRQDPLGPDPAWAEGGVRSYAGVPLRFEGEALGVFFVFHQQIREFPPNDVAFMEAMASRIGTAVAKARLFERLRELNRVLQKRTVELQNANQELEAFSYSVSHDLRAPLRAIEGFSNFLQQECAAQLDVNGLHYVDRVRSGTQRMSALIDGLLKLSRLTRTPMRDEEVDLSQLAGACVAELRAAEPGRQVEVTITPGALVKGDSTLLRAALQNLLENAWKYSRRTPQARIEFGVRQVDGERVFHVRDNGAGFDLAYAGKLFGAFQRMHRAEEFEGTGVGLATVQRIIHRHGGRIWAESAVNQGATFYFTLAPKLDPRHFKP